MPQVTIQVEESKAKSLETISKLNADELEKLAELAASPKAPELLNKNWVVLKNFI